MNIVPSGLSTTLKAAPHSYRKQMNGSPVMTPSRGNISR